MKIGPPLEGRESRVVELYVTPRARRTEWAGWHGGRPRLRVAAPPADGRANEEVRRFLAEWLGLPSSAVQIEAGTSGRIKRVRVMGVGEAEWAGKWPPQPQGRESR